MYAAIRQTEKKCKSDKGSPHRIYLVTRIPRRKIREG